MAKSKKSSSKSSNTKTKKVVKKVAKKAISKMPLWLIILIVLVVIALGVVVYLNKDKIANLFNGNRNNITREYGTDSLVVHYMDVGQGDSILIELPKENVEMLIDCGCKGITKDYETVVLPYLNTYITDGTIEYLVLTHTDEDHVSYLDNVIEDFQVNNIYMPYILSAPGTSSTPKANAQAKVDALDPVKLAMFKDKDTIDTLVYANFFINALSEPNCTIHINADSDKNTTDNVIDGGTYLITFICPTYAFYEATSLADAHAKNAVSPVIILEYNGRKLVFTGDSNAYWSNGKLKTTEGNEWFMVDRIKALYGNSGIDADVLKIAHHGAEEASSNEFLDIIDCEYGVISCGAGNGYQHPRADALNRLKAHNYTIYRTDLNGNIVCIVDAAGNLSFDLAVTKSQDEEYVPAD